MSIILGTKESSSPFSVEGADASKRKKRSVNALATETVHEFVKKEDNMKDVKETKSAE